MKQENEELIEDIQKKGGRTLEELSKDEGNEGEEGNVETFQVVIFTLNGQKYAMDVFQTERIVEMQRITPLPRTEDYIKGITDLRGEITTVIDLKAKLRDEKIDDGMIVTLDTEDENIGVLVDRIIGIERIKETKVQDRDEFSEERNEVEQFIKGIIKRDEEITIWIDLNSLISQIEEENRR